MGTKQCKRQNLVSLKQKLGKLDLSWTQKREKKKTVLSVAVYYHHYKVIFKRPVNSI